jgi:hypothetical protein
MWWKEFTARHGLIPYLNQIMFSLTGLISRGKYVTEFYIIKQKKRAAEEIQNVCGLGG